MEVLGFFDRPYVVHVSTPPRRVARPVVVAEAPRAPALDATSRVAELWETTQIEESALDWWKPHVISRRRLGGSRIRLSAVIGIAVVLVTAVAGLRATLLGHAERVELTRATIVSEAAAIDSLIPELSAVVQALDDPSVPDLATSTEVVLSAESAARALFSAAGALGEDDARIRATAVSGASGVLEVTSTVSRLLAYRLAVEGLLQPPALPDSPGSQDLAQVTEIVTGWRVDVEVGLEEITSSVLPAHRSQLEEWAASLDAWQVAYLDAVRQDDPTSVAAARSDLDAQLESLRATMRAELGTVGGELLSQLADASEAIEALLGD